MKNKIVIINIKDEIASHIGSRDVIDVLAELIERVGKKNIMLDFSNVKFVSRSAMHSLLKMKDNFNKSWNLFNRKKIVFINTNKDFDKMLQSVVASKNYMKRRVDFNPKRVSPEVLFEKNLI